MGVIEPVPRACYPEALSLLVGAGGRPQLAARAAGFEALLTGPDAGRCDFRWARGARGGRCAGLTICNVGASAMIFCSPLGANAADIDVLSGLMGELSAALLGRGVKFVQALLPPTWRLETDAFKRAGFIRLAELVYMQVGTAGAFCITPPQLEWLTVLDVGEAALAEVIADTYVESRDCPALLGIRSMAEVIAAHKASGVYRPQSWLIPQYQGDFIGCALVNDAGAAHDAVDLVYLGIRPRWRQKGFGKIMLRKAISDAAQRGLGRVLLACDSANIPAMALYEHDGFRELDRRLVYIKNAHNNKA